MLRQKKSGMRRPERRPHRRRPRARALRPARAPRSRRSIHCENSIEAERRCERRDASQPVHHRAAPARGSRAPSRCTTKTTPCVVAQLQLVDAGCAQPFGARAFEEMQVARVVDDAAGVGVFPVDAHRPGEEGTGIGRRSGEIARRVMPSPRSSACSLLEQVVGRPDAPRRLQAEMPPRLAVTMRPRAVRMRKPCWIR